MEVKKEFKEYLKSVDVDEEKLAELLGCSEEDFYYDDITSEDEFEDNAIPYRVVYGDVDLTNMSSIDSLGNLEILFGNLTLGNWGQVPSNIEDLGNLKLVCGRVDASYSNLKSFGNLKYVSEDVCAEEAKLESTGDLEYIGGDAILRNNPLNSLGKIKYVGKELDIENTYVKQEEIQNIEVGTKEKNR